MKCGTAFQATHNFCIGKEIYNRLSDATQNSKYDIYFFSYKSTDPPVISSDGSSVVGHLGNTELIDKPELSALDYGIIDWKKTVDAGKNPIIVGISEEALSFIQSNLDAGNYVAALNAAQAMALTVIHELDAHVIDDVFNNDANSTIKDHEIFYGEDFDNSGSPMYHEIKNNGSRAATAKNQLEKTGNEISSDPKGKISEIKRNFQNIGKDDVE